MKELVKGVRHDALGAIKNADKLLKSLGKEEGRGTNKLRRATERFSKHMKEELARWEDKYKQARAQS